MSNELVRREDGSSVRGHVLSLLRDRGPMPRISLAREGGLSPTSITRTINLFLEEGLVTEGATVSPKRLGRPATEVALRTDVYFVVGVQIGIGFVQLGLIDVVGTQVASTGFNYPRESSAEDVLQSTADAIRELIAATPGVEPASILGVGVAAPGPVDSAHRTIVLPVNLTWRNAPVADILGRATGYEVVVEHNVRSMALAEARFGGGRGSGSVAFVYLRTGLGAGLVVEGQPFTGGVHGAIEIGHLHTSPENRPCVCGGRGCLETVVSDAALRVTCERLGVAVTTDGPLASLYAAAGHDARAAEAIEVISSQLAIGLSSLGTLLNPKIVFLGGILGDMPAAFIETLREDTRRSLFPLLRESMTFERSSLGLNAGVTGAGTAALDVFFYA